MPLGQEVHWGDWGAAAKRPGGHMPQLAASTRVVAQPAGQMLHQGSLEGGTGQPALQQPDRQPGFSLGTAGE